MDHPHACPACGAPAYIGLAKVECSRIECEYGPWPEEARDVPVEKRGELVVAIVDAMLGVTAEYMAKRLRAAIKKYGDEEAMIPLSEVHAVMVKKDGEVVGMDEKDALVFIKAPDGKAISVTDVSVSWVPKLWPYPQKPA